MYRYRNNILQIQQNSFQTMFFLPYFLSLEIKFCWEYFLCIDLCITIWSLDSEALRPVMTPTAMLENIWVNLLKVQ